MGGTPDGRRNRLDNVALLCHDHTRISDGLTGSGGAAQYAAAHRALFGGDSYLARLKSEADKSGDGVLAFFTPFMVSVGLQVGALLLALIFRAPYLITSSHIPVQLVLSPIQLDCPRPKPWGPYVLSWSLRSVGSRVLVTRYNDPSRRDRQ